jgi:CRISPR-associated protein Cas2
MYLVLCYDVTDDKRRARLFRQLKAWLHPVQRSVFEGPLPPSNYAALLRLVHRTIDPERDTVRIYHLPEGSRSRTELLGTSFMVAEEPEDILL